jgi:hypothetical protein
LSASNERGRRKKMRKRGGKMQKRNEREKEGKKERNVPTVHGAGLGKMQMLCCICRRLLQFGKNGWKRWKRYQVNCEGHGIGLLHLPPEEQPSCYLAENFGSRFAGAN